MDVIVGAVLIIFLFFAAEKSGDDPMYVCVGSCTHTLRSLIRLMSASDFRLVFPPHFVNDSH